MMILFWGIIILLTLTAWSLLLWPVFRKSSWQIHFLTKMIFWSFPFLVIAVYVLWGNSRQLQQYELWQAQSQEIQKQVALIKNPQDLIERMRKHLRENPQSAQGWYLLGKLYLDQNQFSPAKQALQRAHQLKPDSGEMILYLAKADFLQQGQHLSPAIEALLQSVIESSLSERADAFNLLAVNAYRRQHYHQAVQYWQRALSLVPPDSPDSRALLDMISQAQQKQK